MKLSSHGNTLRNCKRTTFSANRFNRRRFNLTVVLCLLSFCAFSVSSASIAVIPQRGQSANQRESNVRPGAAKYFALIIGNNNYQHLDKLKTAVNDAIVLERVLRESYSFQTKLLANAEREQIVEALNEYRRKLDEQSYLLIYYAGHGFYDRSVDASYWLPVDARRDSDARWISADDVTRNIRGITAPHILIISDSCYSGMLKREALVGITPTGRQRFLEKMRGGRSRILIASGGNEPVDDGGGGGHSVFANALLRGLEQIDRPEFTAGELFNRFILEQVAGKAIQTPEYGVIRNSGHDSGDFVFTRLGTIASNATEPTTLPPPVQPPRQQVGKTQNTPDTDAVNGVTIELMRIPAGKFLMGSPDSEAQRADDEIPQHEVTISRPFYMGKYEVTQAQWRAVAKLPKLEIGLDPDPSNFKGDNLPVEQVNWLQAIEFCERLSIATGKLYRLPTEAEWEYACRAGTKTPFAFGATITPNIANYNGNQPYGSTLRGANRKQTVPVGSLGAANGFGLYDLHGNVWEWCMDWYNKNYYSQRANVDPEGPSTGEYRVYRGGGWSDFARDLRAAYRNFNSPGYHYNYLGFRLVRVGD
jgi:formylglycine-generating enzyme required for sulfatase activity